MELCEKRHNREIGFDVCTLPLSINSKHVTHTTAYLTTTVKETCFDSLLIGRCLCRCSVDEIRCLPPVDCMAFGSMIGVWPVASSLGFEEKMCGVASWLVLAMDDVCGGCVGTGWVGCVWSVDGWRHFLKDGQRVGLIT
jgi:hypothetical protein